MSIKSKVVLLLSVVFSLLAGMTYLVQRVVVLPTFLQLERFEAIEDMERCRDGLRLEIEHLALLCRDWGAWDDTYKYIDDRNEGFAKQTLIPESFTNNRLNLICLINQKRELVWGELRDHKKNELIQMPELLESIRRDERMMTHANFTDTASGLILTSRGPMMIASMAIVTSKNEGPVRGSVLMGRFLSEEEVAGLVKRTRVPLTVWPIQAGRLPQDKRATLAAISEQKPVLISRSVPHHLYVHSTFPAIDGTPALLLQVDLPMDISEAGRSAMWVAVCTTLLMGAGILALMWVRLKYLIVKPLVALRNHAIDVGQNDKLTARLALSRGDEIGVLAREMDRMMERLTETRAKMLDAAHNAGMAEIASEVLHNVGNALNTVNVSTEVMAERLAQSKVKGLNQAAALLGEYRQTLEAANNADRRGPMVVDYIAQLAELLAAENRSLSDELSTVQATVGHIKEIVAVQQNYTGQAKFVQQASLAALVADTLKIHTEQLTRNRITVNQALGDLPPANVEKNRLMQVLVNLVRNAIESLAEKAEGELTLTVRGGTMDDGQAFIELRDTGMGIDPANAGRMFTTGFTTKDSGHGLGLHFCANAMAAMGGSITFHSDGMGKGATFRIVLPLRCEEAVRC